MSLYIGRVTNTRRSQDKMSREALCLNRLGSNALEEEMGRKDLRRYPRVGCVTEALVLGPGRHFSAKLIDISPNGAQIEHDCSGIMAVINRIVIPEFQQRFLGKIAWHTDNRLGICFTEPPYVVLERLPGSLKLLLHAVPGGV